MRILQLIDSLDYGGAEQVVASLAACQSRHGHSVVVACLSDLGPQPLGTTALAEANVDVLELNKPPGFHYQTLQTLAAYLKEQRIDVVHTHNHVVHHYGVAAGRLARYPIVLNTLHGASSLLMSTWRTKVLFWISCVLGHKVVFVCSKVYTDLYKSFRLPKNKLCVVDNGIDLSRFLKIPRQPIGDTVTFGNIGRFDPVKDHKTLIGAFSIIKKKYTKAKLRLLGDGETRHAVEDLAEKLGIADGVLFEGFSRDTDKFLRKIDVYVISSRSEGLPLSLIEAMGASLPIVATAVGGIPEIVQKAGCGWLCPPSDPEKLARAMEKALLERDIMRIGKRSRKAAVDDYSLERMARNYEQLYTQLLTSRGADYGG